MSKSGDDVTDSAPEAPREGLPWTSQTCLSAIDGAVVGNTLGFVVGAFPGMCIGAASGGIAGVLGGGLVAPVMKPAARVAAGAMPGKFVLSANGAANSMIGKLCIGPRTELGKGGKAEEASEQSTEFTSASPAEPAGEPEAQGAVENFEEIPEEQISQADESSSSQHHQQPRSQQLQLLSRPTGELAAAKEALDTAMVRASAAGAQGAIAGAEVGGAVVGTALAIPGAVLGSLLGGVVGMCMDVQTRYFRELEQSASSIAAVKDAPAPAKQETGSSAPAANA